MTLWKVRMRLLPVVIIAVFISTALAVENPDITLSSLLKDTVAVDTFYLPRTGYPGVWSSYDRTGGSLDNQGYIRLEGESYVIAEMMGPGAITRLWANQPSGKIDIFVDDGGKPVLSIPVTDLFQGKLSPFILPWVTFQKDAGCFSFVPIPYNRFCKIISTELFEYEIDYQSYPSQTTIEAFTIPVSKAHLATQTSVSKSLQSNGKPPFQVGKDFIEDAFAFTIPAAETVEFATFSGPAIIKGIQIQWDNREVNLGRDLVLNVNWNQQTEPAVQVPFYDFFGGGSNNWLIGTGENNEGYCYFPMPFQQEARFSVRNDSLKDDISVHITIFIQSVKPFSEPLRHFHAEWHYEQSELKTFPVVFDMQRKTPLTDSTHCIRLWETRANGHLAAVAFTQIDSTHSDIQLSTFSGLRENHLISSGIHGFLNTAMTTKAAAYSFSGSSDQQSFAASRLFLPTPVSMEENTYLIMENGHGNLAKQTTAAVLYWYQEGENQQYHQLPPAQARHFRQTGIRHPVFVVESDRLVPQPALEAETAVLNVVGGVFEPQDMSAYGTDWSQNQQIRFEAFQEEAELEIQLPDVQYSGWYQLQGVFTLSPDSGIIAIHNQDHVIQKSLDLYAEVIQPKSYICPSKLFIHAGEPVILTITMKGMNPESTGWNAGIDFLELIPQSWNPNEISINGPFYLESTSPEQTLQFNSIQKSLELPVGFAEPSKLKSIELKWNAKQPGFSFDSTNIASQFKDTNAIVLVQFDVRAEQSGIFHFELQGNSIQNYTLWLSDDRFIKSLDRIWVNGIPLKAEDRRFWDIETNDFKPLRYPIPLQKGNNKILWMMDYHPNALFTPVFYGIAES